MPPHDSSHPPSRQTVDESMMPASMLCVDQCRGVVLSVVFQPKQLTLVSGSDDADVRVWDLVTKSCVAVLKVSPARARLPAVQLCSVAVAAFP